MAALDRTTEPAAGRPRWSTMLRIAVEFALLFGIALIAKLAVAAASPGAYPNPLWLPVIVLSLQHGLGAGLAAAVIAAGVQYWAGLPPPLMTEDMYGYIGRIAAEPVGWTCVALLIGHVRSRQIAQNAELEAELAERGRHSAAVAALCVDLRARTEMLERHIAAGAEASNIEVAEAVAALQQADWDEFAPRLTRFVAMIAGAAEFSVYLIRDGALKISFQPGDEHRAAADTAVALDDPLFAAIVQERRTLSAARPADGALIGNRGVLAGPLLDTGAPERVIGMLTIGGSSLDELPDDIERRFALVAAEVSRQASRINLLDTWHAAAAPSRPNGHRHDATAPEPTGPSAEPVSEPGPEPTPHAPPEAEARTDDDDAAIPPKRPTLPDNEFTLR